MNEIRNPEENNSSVTYGDSVGVTSNRSSRVGYYRHCDIVL